MFITYGVIIMFILSVYHFCYDINDEANMLITYDEVVTYHKCCSYVVYHKY